MSKTVELELLAKEIGEQKLHERVPAEQLGPNHYRLLASPGFVPGIASGDEIALAPTERGGYRVLRRSGNVSILMFFKSLTVRTREAITKEFQSISGWLDGGNDNQGGHLLIFTIPLDRAGFSKIEAAVECAQAIAEIDSWHYGNVYDPADGVTPIGWWN